jgi:predicted O-methyltransferase YrrM
MTMDGRQSTNLVNVARFALAKPGNLGVMARKVLKRFLDPSSSDRWETSIDPAEYANQVEPELWAEAKVFGETLRGRADRILQSVPFEIGGGADYEFLYWLTRLLKPSVVVETGVAAGWTSEAFLQAIKVNGNGKLYSSDFPYFRVKDPERYVGILVSDRSNWELHIDGDENALPRIVASVPQIDLFHYDSDKSYSGRQMAADLVLPKLKGPFIMDDIADNKWFRHFTKDRDYAIIGRAGYTPPPPY